VERSPGKSVPYFVQLHRPLKLSVKSSPDWVGFVRKKKPTASAIPAGPGYS